jgi:hypothetical protein
MATVRTRRSGWAIGGLLALAWLSTCGALGPCDLFKPEEPEPSKNPPVIGNYTDPESTLNALVYGVRSRGKDGGDGVYRAALADSQANGDPDGSLFRSYFDIVTANRYFNQTGNNPPNWTRYQESSFFNNYFVGENQGLTYDLRWVTDPSPGNPVPGPDTYRLYKQYTVTVRQNSGKIDTVASGFADLFFRKPSTRWVLVNWLDREDPAFPAKSFGQLRLDHQ